MFTSGMCSHDYGLALETSLQTEHCGVGVEDLGLGLVLEPVVLVLVLRLWSWSRTFGLGNL